MLINLIGAERAYTYRFNTSYQSNSASRVDGIGRIAAAQSTTRARPSQLYLRYSMALPRLSGSQSFLPFEKVWTRPRWQYAIASNISDKRITVQKTQHKVK